MIRKLLRAQSKNPTSSSEIALPAISGIELFIFLDSRVKIRWVTKETLGGVDRFFAFSIPNTKFWQEFNCLERIGTYP